MSRILLAWELGQNLGHLARLLPLATRLVARGHSVLVVARDLRAAGEILGPHGIPFVQAPCLVRTDATTPIMNGYPDIVLAAGWRNRKSLWSLCHAWINLFRLFHPQVAILDHAPTARLAARIETTPCLWVGTGFSLPPPLDPLPAFPGFSPDKSTESERIALSNANAVLNAAGSRRLDGLKDLFAQDEHFLTTFPDLDHYGARPEGTYVGSLGDVRQGDPVKWPAGPDRKVFAYLRPQMPNLVSLLSGLVESEAGVVCYVPGIQSDVADRFSSRQLLFSPKPVQYDALFAEADVLLSYAPSGTVTSALLRGIPQLMAPIHVESTLTARQVTTLGAGIELPRESTATDVATAIQQLVTQESFKASARGFAFRHRAFDAASSADQIADRADRLCQSEP